jgi:hypothetical protein
MIEFLVGLVIGIVGTAAVALWLLGKLPIHPPF